MNKNIEFAFQWLKKADNDIVTAKQTFLLPDGPIDTVCFHTQQAVEKALKALLTFHNMPFPKIHELLRLLDMAVPFLPELEEFRENFAEMSNYAVEVRYPSDYLEPTRDDASKSINIADEVLKKVRHEMNKIS